MAIPVLYWMLECMTCGSRRVVHDSYLKFVGTPDTAEGLGTGYGGPPLPERYTCAKECSGRMKAIGSIFEPGDETMWLDEPHVPLRMTRAQSNEWQQLIHAAGFSETTPNVAPRKVWWRIW